MLSLSTSYQLRQVDPDSLPEFHLVQGHDWIVLDENRINLWSRKQLHFVNKDSSNFEVSTGELLETGSSSKPELNPSSFFLVSLQ